MKKFQELEHWVFLAWLLLAGFAAFGLVVCWNEGLLALLIDSDRSRICLVIALLYAAGTAHCALRASMLARETDRVSQLEARIGARQANVTRLASGEVAIDGVGLPSDSVIGEHLEVLLGSARDDTIENADGEQATATSMLVARTKGSHDFGWFVVDSLVKLGLLGTIVGFILMLGSVADTASLDVNTMQKVLKQMSNGMGTALYTTLAGLVGSMSLGMQYLLLDKGADKLIENILRLGETRLIAR